MPSASKIFIKQSNMAGRGKHILQDLIELEISMKACKTENLLQ